MRRCPTSGRWTCCPITRWGVQLVRDGVFDVLTVPKDDTAEYGYAALDQMALAARARDVILAARRAALEKPGGRAEE